MTWLAFAPSVGVAAIAFVAGMLVGARRVRASIPRPPAVMLCESRYHSDYTLWRCQLTYGHTGDHRSWTRGAVKTWTPEAKRAWDVARGPKEIG